MVTLYQLGIFSWDTASGRILDDVFKISCVVFELLSIH